MVLIFIAIGIVSFIALMAVFKRIGKVNGYYSDHISPFQYGQFCRQVKISFDEFLRVYPVVKDRITFDYRGNNFCRLVCPRIGCRDASVRYCGHPDGYQIVFPKSDIMTFARWNRKREDAIEREQMSRELKKRKEQDIENLRGFLECVQRDIEKMRAESQSELKSVEDTMESVANANIEFIEIHK